MSQFDPSTRNESKLAAAIRRLFPAREIVVRCEGRVRYYSLSTARQAGFAGVVGLAALWGVFASAAHFVDAQALRLKDAEVASSAAAYQSLVDQVADHRERMEAIAESLAQEPVDLAEDAPIDQQLQRMEASLASADAQRRVAEVRQHLVGRLEALAERIRTNSFPPAAPIAVDGEAPHDRVARLREVLQDGLRRQLDRFGQNVASVSRLAGDTTIDQDKIDRHKLMLQRDLMARERDELSAQVGQLQARVADIQGSHAEVVQRFSEFASGSLTQVEKALGSVGLDVKKLVDKDPATAAVRPLGGQGGPFIPAGPLSAADQAKLHATLASLNFKIGRWDNLQEVIRRVPLGTPVRSSQISSPFGVREDPINGNPARHEGMDFAAPSRTPVFAPSSGVVVFAGWKDRFGRTVILDHGHGFTTLYGHLHKTLVTVGQKVESGKQIGEIGSTGRSTGPHLHYEVHINGKPQDPLRFIKAGRHVLKG